MKLVSIDRKILALYEDHQRKEKNLIHLKNIEKLIAQKEKLLVQLEEQVRQEEKDIQKLESFNLHRIFHTILGNQEEQLEKERQEFLQAILQHKGCVKSLAALKKSRDSISRSISGQFSVKRKLNKLLKEKEKDILAKKKPAFKKVLRYAQRLSGHQAKMEEIRQCIRVGNTIKDILDKIKFDFETLENWHGGLNFKISVRGRTQVRRIEKNIYKTNNQIQLFREELLDLNDHFAIDYEYHIQSISDFLQQLVDTMITDWVIQKQLANSLNLLTRLFDKISLMNSMLDLEIKKTKEYIRLEKEEKEALIIKILQEVEE